MGIADDILRKGFRTVPKATPPQESVASDVLAEASSHTQDSNTFQSDQKTVGATPTAIFGPSREKSTAVICNLGTQTIFLGPQSVSAISGHGLPPGASISGVPMSNLWAIVASGTAILSYLKDTD